MRILIIEDDKEVASLLKRGCEEECFAVDAAHDGEEGAKLAKLNDYDAIILDYELPGKSGKDVVADVRGKGKTTPILMLTVRRETKDKVDLLNAGADDYLTKPFSIEELIARVRALLRRPKQIEGDVLAIGDLTLDSRRHKVTRRNKDVYLTHKEFMLLEYLMRNVGTVLTRTMIMEHVWDMNADPFSNTIESHVRSLRRKVDFTDKKLIHTIPNMGYKIEAPK